MSGFLYYIPGVQSLASPLASLSHIGKTLAQRGVFSNGPDGGGGLLLAIGGAHTPAVKVDLANQTWVKAACGEYWIGTENGKTPGPFDLAKREIVGGHFVTLADGNDWLIPCARSDVRQIDLPQSLRLGPNGEWVSETLPEFLEFCDRVERSYESFFEVMQAQREYRSAENVIPDSELIALAVDGLSVNYHLSAQEISVLGLLTSANLFGIIGALFDWPTIERIVAREASEKKTSAVITESPELAVGVAG